MYLLAIIVLSLLLAVLFATLLTKLVSLCHSLYTPCCKNKKMTTFSNTMDDMDFILSGAAHEETLALPSVPVPRGPSSSTSNNNPQRPRGKMAPSHGAKKKKMMLEDTEESSSEDDSSTTGGEEDADEDGHLKGFVVHDAEEEEEERARNRKKKKKDSSKERKPKSPKSPAKGSSRSGKGKGAALLLAPVAPPPATTTTTTTLSKHLEPIKNPYINIWNVYRERVPNASSEEFHVAKYLATEGKEIDKKKFPGKTDTEIYDYFEGKKKAYGPERCAILKADYLKHRAFFTENKERVDALKAKQKEMETAALSSSNGGTGGDANGTHSEEGEQPHQGEEEGGASLLDKVTLKKVKQAKDHILKTTGVNLNHKKNSRIREGMVWMLLELHRNQVNAQSVLNTLEERNMEVLSKGIARMFDEST